MHGALRLNKFWNFPALIRRYDDIPATITHVPVAAVLVLNTSDDGQCMQQTDINSIHSARLVDEFLQCIGT